MADEVTAATNTAGKFWRVAKPLAWTSMALGGICIAVALGPAGWATTAAAGATNIGSTALAGLNALPAVIGPLLPTAPAAAATAMVPQGLLI